MSDSAQVSSIDALRQFRAKLCEFGVDGLESLAAVELELRHMEDWLSERLKYWQLQLRDRGEDLSRAKAKLVQHKWGSKDGKGVGTTEVEMEVKKAKHRIDEAEAKIEVTKRWQRDIPKTVHEYEGPARQLSGYLESDLKQVLALLDRMATSLEAYVAISAPAGGTTPTPVSTEPETAGETGSQPCT
jgi:hypothetical protein